MMRLQQVKEEFCASVADRLPLMLRMALSQTHEQWPFAITFRALLARHKSDPYQFETSGLLGCKIGRRPVQGASFMREYVDPLRSERLSKEFAVFAGDGPTCGEGAKASDITIAAEMVCRLFAKRSPWLMRVGIDAADLLESLQLTLDISLEQHPADHQWLLCAVRLFVGTDRGRPLAGYRSRMELCKVMKPESNSPAVRGESVVEQGGSV